MGRFWKLFGNLAVEVEAMAEALRIAKGFLPVIELPAAAPPETKLLVPLVLVVLEIPPFGPVLAVGCYDAPLPPAVGCEVKLRTSARNYSML